MLVGWGARRGKSGQSGSATFSASLDLSQFRASSSEAENRRENCLVQNIEIRMPTISGVNFGDESFFLGGGFKFGVSQRGGRQRMSEIGP